MNVLRKLPIRGQMYLIAALTMIVIVAILLFNYNRSAAFLIKNNEVSTDDIFSQMEQTILSNYDVIKWLAYNIAYNKSVQDYLLENDPLIKLEQYPTIKNLFLNLSTVKTGILDFVVIGKNGNSFSLQGSDINQFGDFMPKRSDSYFSKVQTCKAPGGLPSYCFAVGTNIFSSEVNNQYASEIGRIVLLIDASTLTGGYDLKSLQPGTSVYLLDRENTIFMSNDRDVIGQTFDLPDSGRNPIKVRGQWTHVQIADLPQIGGKVVRLIPDNVFFSDIRNLRKQSLIALAVGLLLLLVPFVFILNNMIGPLRKLYHNMRISGKDDLNKRIDLRGSTEARVIGMRYNQMLADVQHLTEQVVESNDRLLKSEIEKKRAEFNYLKSQVNPHFLYNTLDVIRGIASAREVPEIREMTGALSRIFRYAIKGSDVVPLREELRIVEAYMSIQTLRFSQRFALVCDIPPELLDMTVPKMILQPIVENAVYHGLEPRYEQGTLVLSARLAGERGKQLLISVKDDGVGMSGEKLERCRLALQDGDGQSESGGGAGIGLANVHNRLQHVYGSGYGLEIDSKEKAGTVVTLRIPAQPKGEEADVLGHDR